MNLVEFLEQACFRSQTNVLGGSPDGHPLMGAIGGDGDHVRVYQTNITLLPSFELGAALEEIEVLTSGELQMIDGVWSVGLVEQSQGSSGDLFFMRLNDLSRYLRLRAKECNLAPSRSSTASSHHI